MKKRIYSVPVCDVCFVIGSNNVLVTIDFNSVEETSGGTINANDVKWEDEEETTGTALNVWDKL